MKMTDCHQDIGHILKQGAVSFLQKPFNPQDFLHNINRIARLAGERFEARVHKLGMRQQLDKLSAREREVLDGVLEGKTSKQLARDLGISPKTIDVHRANVMRKLLVSNSAELVSRVGALRAATKSD